MRIEIVGVATTFLLLIVVPGELDGVELRCHLDEREAIELCLLAGHYEMLATTIKALRIQPEAPRRGLLASLRG